MVAKSLTLVHHESKTLSLSCPAQAFPLPSFRFVDFELFCARTTKKGHLRNSWVQAENEVAVLKRVMLQNQLDRTNPSFQQSWNHQPSQNLQIKA